MYDELQSISNKIRRSAFEAIHRAGGGHFGGCMSVIEILTSLYFGVMRVDPQKSDWYCRDRLILSKGHGGPALYAVLAEKGFFPKDWLEQLDKPGGRLPKHVDRLKVPGVDVSCGALGQGLSVGCGMALAVKQDMKDIRVHVIMGEGECNSGQIWEAAMLASKYHLDNITAIIDQNNLQIDGSTEDVMPMEPFGEKWRSFGWNVLKIDGHCIPEIFDAYKKAFETKGKPTVIIARTIKGKGIKIMESRCEWHSGKLTDEQFLDALGESKRGESQGVC